MEKNLKDTINYLEIQKNNIIKQQISDNNNFEEQFAKIKKIDEELLYY